MMLERSLLILPDSKEIRGREFCGQLKELVRKGQTTQRRVEYNGASWATDDFEGKDWLVHELDIVQRVIISTFWWVDLNGHFKTWSAVGNLQR